MSVDRNPNVRGALMTGLIDTLPEERLENLGSKIDSGEVTTVLSVKEDLTEAGLSEEQFSKVDIVYLGTHRNATSDKAEVVLAGLTQFEKSGTVINQRFRIQNSIASTRTQRMHRGLICFIDNRYQLLG